MSKEEARKIEKEMKQAGYNAMIVGAHTGKCRIVGKDLATGQFFYINNREEWLAKQVSEMEKEKS